MRARVEKVDVLGWNKSLGSFNNCKIIQLSHKSTLSDAFDYIHQVVIDGISDNMATLVESGKYGSINTTGTSTNSFMLSCSHKKHIHFRITQKLMDKLSLLGNWLLKKNIFVLCK